MDRRATERTSESADAAVRRLVAEHGDRLFALASRFCGNTSEAEDLVQEVFLSAFRGWDRFRGEAQESTWLYRIAARACQRMHRRRSGEPEHIASLDAPLPFDEPLIAAIPSEQPDGVQAQIRREARERLESEIAALPEPFRVPLVLRDIVGFSVHEVSEILGLEEGTVRTRVHRGRLKLRAAVDSVVPRRPGTAPPAAYPERTCLDLLEAKQSAMDRGVPFDQSVICDRCRSVFATLDLTQDVCRELGHGSLPPALRRRLLDRINAREDSE
ncbi:MAG: RNA polymerase sigma factor [Phycisphaerales bacterium]